MKFQIKSGYGSKMLPFWAVFNLYIIFICTSIPGLAISPIMGDLTKIFPGTSALETQMLEVGPNFAAIPFVFLGGWIGTKFNNNRLTFWTCLFFGCMGVLFFFVKSMIMLILLSFLIGIAAGILSPLASAFIADMFDGDKRSAQYGYTSATLNLVLMGCVIATGYLAKINWRLPFMIYLLPFVPLFFSKGFGKYITDPKKLRATEAAKKNVPKVHYKFSQEVNMKMLIRYCAFYFFITLVIAAISLYIPFLFKNSSTAGDLTSVLFFGIMASGYTLNWCLRILKNWVAVVVIIAITVGFLLIVVAPASIWIVGLGILLATYFYGIAQPAYYNKLSQASSRIALTLTLAWFASMDSIGNVVAPFVIDGIAKVFHQSTQAHPVVAFQICMWMALAAAAVVIIRKIVVSARAKELEDKA
ncbi:MAG: MFS transporter, partial [Muribaculaceae bacterium]|nr:MFS transporter [Muribaculaceae bacterium]